MQQMMTKLFNRTASFFSVQFLPRWIIILLDLIVVVVSGIMSYLLLKGVGVPLILELTIRPIQIISLYLGVTVLFFYIFKTYTGVIRHSTYIDAVKLFLAQLGTFVTFLSLNYLWELLYATQLFLNTRLFLNVLLSFTGLLLYRIIIKQTFDYYQTGSQEGKLIPVVIYGVDANAISVANAMKGEMPKRFKLVGFIDKNPSRSSKRLLDLPILNQKKSVAVLLRSLGAKALIIADKTLSNKDTMVIVDDCLEHHFKIYSVPGVTDWEDQKHIAKNIKNIKIEDLLERKPIVLDVQSVTHQIKNKVVLVTGAAGSIGSEIVRQVSSYQPKLLILVDVAETPLHHMSLELRRKFPNLNFYACLIDVRDRVALESIFRKYTPHLIYHAAAYKHVPLMEEHPQQAILTNVLGTKNMADLALAYGSEKFVMVSTDKAVNPSNVMGASKRIAELYVQLLTYAGKQNDAKTTKYITTRFGNVLGSNGSVVPLFTRQIEAGGPITLTHPDIIRYFMTIPEACQLVLEAGAMGKGGEIFVFDMGKPVKIIDLALKMIRLAGLEPETDIAIEMIGLRPGEKLYEELLTDGADTLPTHHEKIMIASERNADYAETALAIDELLQLNTNSDKNLLVAQMKKIVPEFKSNNSEFETLDVMGIKRVKGTSNAE
jgi:FlaA1/EpsC-like NDP-sugar epimerase